MELNLKNLNMLPFLSIITKSTIESEPLEITNFLKDFIPEVKFEKFHGKEV